MPEQTPLLLEAIDDAELLQARHNARRTRCKGSEPHPFHFEATLSEEALYERVDEKAKHMFETMPSVKDEKDLRRRVTAGVVFWAEFYEHKYNAEQEAETREWEYEQKVKALEKKRDQLVEKAVREVNEEIDEAARALAEEKEKAKTNRAQEREKYPEWFKAADELDEMLKPPAGMSYVPILV